MCLSYQQFKGRAVSPLSLVKPFWKLRYHGDSESSQFDYKKKNHISTCYLLDNQNIALNHSYPLQAPRDLFSHHNVE